MLVIVQPGIWEWMDCAAGSSPIVPHLTLFFSRKSCNKHVSHSPPFFSSSSSFSSLSASRACPLSALIQHNRPSVRCSYKTIRIRIISLILSLSLAHPFKLQLTPSCVCGSSIVGCWLLLLRSRSVDRLSSGSAD